MLKLWPIKIKERPDMQHSRTQANFYPKPALVAIEPKLIELRTMHHNVLIPTNSEVKLPSMAKLSYRRKDDAVLVNGHEQLYEKVNPNSTPINKKALPSHSPVIRPKRKHSTQFRNTSASTLSKFNMTVSGSSNFKGLGQLIR